MIHFSSLGLQIKNMLGSGSFAQVFQCFDPKQQREYAVKMIKKESMPQSKMRLFSKEAEILASIDHKNIVKFHSFHETDQCLIIKMEHIKGGTLKTLIEQRKKRRISFRQSEIALFFKHLLEGIRYLHALNIIHRDLKPENILFEDCQDLSTVKIVDFGLSAKLEIHNPVNIKTQCGTLLYMAPEIFNKPSYTKSVDLWSCAVIMYMLFNSGQHPFYYPGMKTDEFKLRLKNESFPPLSEVLAQNFLEKISKKEYEQRYNVNDALKHPWITRNEADQIPLSIHESFKGFDSTNEIITLLRLFLTVGKVISHRKAEIEESYRFKINDFINNNQAVRVYSPSRRKMKDKNNELFNKMKQIFHVNQDIKNNSEIMALSENFSEVSPTLKKHESFFQSLFDKEKSFDLMKTHEKFDLQKLDLRNFHSNHFQPFQKQDMLISLRPKMQVQYEQQYFKNEKENPQLQAKIIEKQLKIKIEHQIQESVNHAFKDSRLSPITKKRIFQKKSSIQTKQPNHKGNVKMAKRFSSGAEVEKFQSSKKDYNFSLSSKQINRRTMSPIKNNLNKAVFFNIANKNLSYTYRK